MKINALIDHALTLYGDPDVESIALSLGADSSDSAAIRDIMLMLFDYQYANDAPFSRVKDAAWMAYDLYKSGYCSYDADRAAKDYGINKYDALSYLEIAEVFYGLEC